MAVSRLCALGPHDSCRIRQFAPAQSFGVRTVRAVGELEESRFVDFGEHARSLLLGAPFKVLSLAVCSPGAALGCGPLFVSFFFY